MKKPSVKAEAPQLTADQLASLNREQEAQNEQLNVCVQACVKKLQDKTTAILDTIHKLNNMDATPVQRKIIQVSVDELNGMKAQAGALVTEMQTMQVEMRDVKHTDHKIDRLNAAGTFINEVDGIIKGCAPYLKKTKQ